MKPLGLISKMMLAFTLPFAAAYYFLVIPQVRAVGDGLSKVAELRNSSTATLSVKQRDAFKAQLATVRDQATRLMPVADDQYDLSVQIEALSKAKQVSLTALNTSAAVATTLPKTTPAKDESGGETAAAPAAATSAVLKVSIATTAVGSYENVQAFIAGLTSIDRFVQVDQVVMNVSSDGSVAAGITAFGYYLPKK